MSINTQHMSAKKILIVDDSPDILELLTLILELESYEVRGIVDGLELDASVENFHPDLILLDVMLGHVDGRDLCKRLKANNSTKSIAVIMISASHNLSMIATKQCKPDDFIAKPFDIDDLLQKIARQLQKNVISSTG